MKHAPGTTIITDVLPTQRGFMSCYKAIGPYAEIALDYEYKAAENIDQLSAV